MLYVLDNIWSIKVQKYDVKISNEFCMERSHKIQSMAR